MRVLTMLFLLAAGPCSALVAAEPALMPVPVKVQAGQGTFAINSNFVVDTVGGANARLAPAVSAFLARLSRQTGVLYAPVPPAATDARRLTIECAGGAGYPALGEDESYTLDVSAGQARIKAATADGAIHALATFAQLIQPGPDGYEVSGVHIEDRPRFPWRGLMLDVCRHWMPVEVVKRNLDAMWSVKMNVLHWHLSEDQGFRVESKRYPRLHELGSNGDYYTQDQVRDVINYARDRGIRVIPEFDVPGHSGAWFFGYPELASAPGPFTWGARGGVSAMDPSKETTYAMLDGFIGEMAQLFPDPYYHIGGDEVAAREWNQSPTIQAFAKEHGFKDAAAIQVYFNQRLLKIVQKYGKVMVGWDEILVPGLPTDAVIQSWRGQKSLSEAAVKGYRGILSWGYYLDHLSPASFHYEVDPLGGPDAAKLTPEQASRVMGGEACMWAELVGPETVDSRVWPRTAAIAERLWSSRETTNVDSMYTRLEPISRNLEFTGVQHRAYYLSSIDRIAGSQPVGPVRVLANLSEAMGLGTGRTGRPVGVMPLNRFVDACQPESELARSLELAAKRLVANSADAADRGLLRGNFEAWVANDPQFQPLAQNNKLLAEVAPLSKDLAAMGEAGIKLLDMLTPAAPPDPKAKAKKLNAKQKKALADEQTARAEWLAKVNADITRLSAPPRRAAAGAAPVSSADVRLAAFRPVKVLVDAVAPATK